MLRVVFKRVRRGPKSRYLIRSKYFFDLLAVIGSSLFFYKSDVLATYVSIIVNRHRNLIKYLGDVRRTLKV